MSKTHILIDSGADLGTKIPEGVSPLRLTVRFGTEEYTDGLDLTMEQFYEKLAGEIFPATSQPGPETVRAAIGEALEQADDVLVLTLSEKLSGTYQSALLGSKGFGKRVRVVSTNNATVGERALLDYALRLRGAGKTLEEMAEGVLSARERCYVLGVVDTLTYLKKGGRISAAAAAAGGLLGLKPVLIVRDGVIESPGKARGSKRAFALMNELIGEMGIDHSMPIRIGCSGLSEERLKQYMDMSRDLWKLGYEQIDPVHIGCIIGAHVGPEAVAVGFFTPEGA